MIYVTKLSCLCHLWPVTCIVTLSPHTPSMENTNSTPTPILQNGKSILQGFQKNITMLILLHEKFLQFVWLTLEQWYFSFIWNTYTHEYYKPFAGSRIAWFVCDIWHKYHLWYFKIVSNFTCLTAREITYNNFETSLMVFMPNVTTNNT